WDLHIGRMRAMPGDAIDDCAFRAHLGPAGETMRAAAAAAVVVHHDPRADARSALVDLGPDGRHGAAGLVPSNDRAAYLSQAKRRCAPCRAIKSEVAAAHAGCLDLDNDLARSRHRIGKFRELQFAVAEKGRSAHGLSSLRAHPLQGTRWDRQ